MADSLKKNRTSVSGIPNKQEQAELARHVGVRLKEAREMVGLSQLNAAKQIGYSNSTKLSKIETGRHSSQVPMWVLKRAAQVYDVSLDYLLGITESMEQEDSRHSALREMMVHMRQDWERMRGRDVLVQSNMLERIKSVEKGVIHMDVEATAAETAVLRLIELNPEAWDDLRGGCKVLSTAQATAAAARNARRNMQRFRSESRASGGAPQLDLVFV